MSSIRKPAFELIVLGSGGGPLETDCSGYLVKPLNRRWEDGLIGLEGGSGLGALAALFATQQSQDMFPSLTFPSTHNTPVLKAAYLFSLLTCYLLTHAHLDHVLSLIMLSGSIPQRQVPPTALLTPTSPSSRPKAEEAPPTSSRTPIYATPETLSRLSLAYGGDLWPELGSWGKDYRSKLEGKGADWDRNNGKRRKLRSRVVEESHTSCGEGTGGSGVAFYPLAPAELYAPLHCTLPISTLVYPVAHGATSKGMYGSSAMFIKYDPDLIDTSHEEQEGAGGEFLFFGDVESSWRPPGDEGVNEGAGDQAGQLNRAIWTQAAKSIEAGTLRGIFIECSYDSSRAAGLMYGHLSPPSLYYELKTLASYLSAKIKPLSNLTIYITHIKENLVPHPTGLSARDLISNELEGLERDGQLGVKFVCIKPGDRIDPGDSGVVVEESWG